MMKRVLKKNQRASFAATAALLLLYAASVWLPSGVITHLLASVPAAAIGITALARVNDLSEDHASNRWQIRRLGLILAGVASVIYILGGLAAATHPIEWREVLLLYGVAFTWVTTPDQPPWWQYITGEKRIFKRNTHD